jgi:hypothetical protein
VAQNDTFTLDDIDSQISAFLQGVQGGTLSARDSLSRGLPSGCTLAVSSTIRSYLHRTNEKQCSFLNFTLPGQVSYSQSTTYEYEESRYWSVQQASAEPICRFSPTSAPDVSIAVLTNRVTQCEFAVKSGGHAAFSGASNINGAMTTDLINLNQVSVSADPDICRAKKPMVRCVQRNLAYGPFCHWRKSCRYWRGRLDSWWRDIILFWTVRLGM